MDPKTRIVQAKDALRVSATVRDAVKRLDTTEDALRNLFKRHGAGKLRDHLAATSVANDGSVDVDLSDFVASSPANDVGNVQDPVKAREDKEERGRHKRQIDQLVDQLREARARQSFLDGIASHRLPPRLTPRETGSGMREACAVVLASDWHIEEPVDPESVAYRNEYSLDIASKRVDRFFRGIIWNVEHQRASKRVAIRDLVLSLLGDFFSGYIHEELVEANALSPVQAVRWLIPRLVGGIRSLLDELNLERLIIPCSIGNHGRTTPKTRIQTGYANSFEWLMYNSIADEFRDDKRVTFEITPSPHQYVQVYDFTIHFHHGDSLKYAGGVGGLAVPLLKAVPAWDMVKRADVHCIGHFHQLSDFGRAVVNGSLIGYGPYSQWIRAQFEPPQQMFFLMDRARGKCQVTPIWVGEQENDRQVKAAV